jgi:hypothetical protein
MLPADVHNLQPVVRCNFPLHAVRMIFHRLLGKRKMIWDFLVRQTACQKWEQLLFPSRQPQTALQCRRRKCPRLFFNILKRNRALRARADSLAIATARAAAITSFVDAPVGKNPLIPARKYCFASCKCPTKPWRLDLQELLNYPFMNGLRVPSG